MSSEVKGLTTMYHVPRGGGASTIFCERGSKFADNWPVPCHELPKEGSWASGTTLPIRFASTAKLMSDAGSSLADAALGTEVHRGRLGLHGSLESHGWNCFFCTADKWEFSFHEVRRHLLSGSVKQKSHLIRGTYVYVSL